MITSYSEIERARLPASQLGRLAALRCTTGVEVALHDRELWIRWDSGDDALARSLLALPDCRLYGRRDGRWHAWRQTLPAFDVPEDLRFRPLWQVVFPAPVQPLVPTELHADRASLALVTDDMFRPASACQCSLPSLLAWADGMPACVVNRLQAVIHGNRIFVLGKKLPWLEPAERFWGRSLLAPLGYRPSPRLGEADLRRASGIADTDLAILRPHGCEIIALERFTALSHAALRLACAEVRS